MNGENRKYTVFFDIDGTLLMTGGAGRQCFVDTFREDFAVVEPKGDVSFAGRSDRAIALELMELNGVEASEENWGRFQRGYCQRIEAAVADNVGRILPGVERLLDRIDELGHVVVGLLTGNLEQGARAKLARYGLSERFAFGGFGDHYKDRNDIAAAAVRAAEQHLAALSDGVGPKLLGSMVIGDTVSDVECARSIGACAVAVTTGHTSAEELSASEPDLLLSDLTDVEALMSVIHAAQDS